MKDPSDYYVNWICGKCGTPNSEHFNTVPKKCKKCGTIRGLS